MTVLVATTIAGWCCDGMKELSWLRSAELMREHSPVDLEFFCAIQHDDAHPGIPSECASLVGRLSDVVPSVVDRERLSWWLFSIDSEAWRPTTRDRLIGITTGRNLIREYALRDTDATHVLFLDADVEPDPMCIPKLLELEHPVVGGDVPSYCLAGPRVLCRNGHTRQKLPRGKAAYVDGEETEYCSYVRSYGVVCDPLAVHVQEHWNTAGFLLVRRDVLRQVAWRWDPDETITDDPCFAQDVERAGFGKTWVRKDCIGKHARLIPVEAR